VLPTGGILQGNVPLPQRQNRTRTGTIQIPKVIRVHTGSYYWFSWLHNLVDGKFSGQFECLEVGLGDIESES
jgi:hypothetical protein